MYKPKGPYSLVRKASNLYFISGILPLDEEGNLIKEPQSAFNKVMEILKEIIASEGLKMEDIVKITVYLKDQEHASVFNEIYARYFKKYPARSMVFVKSLPMDSIIEIDAIAFKES